MGMAQAIIPCHAGAWNAQARPYVSNAPSGADSPIGRFWANVRPMEKTLRIVLGVIGSLVLAALATVVLEPFFSEILTRIGIDSSSWVEPMIEILSSHREWLLFLVGLVGGVWLHWGAMKFDKRAKAMTETERVKARASAIADDLATRIRYVDHILTDGNQSDVSKWKQKIDFQRTSFSALPLEIDTHLPFQAARKLNFCRLKYDELDRCIDSIRDRKGYRSNAQAAGMYRQRALKLHDALIELVAEVDIANSTTTRARLSPQEKSP